MNVEILAVETTRETKRKVIEAANEKGLSLKAWVAWALSVALDDPEVAKLPEPKRPGRRPKKIASAAIPA